MPHEIATFRGGVESERLDDQGADLVERAGAGVAQERLQFRERQLDRIEVRTLRRKKPELDASRGECRVDLWLFVDGEVVQDDHTDPALTSAPTRARRRRGTSAVDRAVAGGRAEYAGAASAGAGAASDLLGTWTGTWEGAGSTGGFELTLEKGKDASTTGRVSISGEPVYKAIIRTLTFEGKRMTATYDFPPDDSMEVVLPVTFDGTTAKGPWFAHQKAGGEIASGTLTLRRK